MQEHAQEMILSPMQPLPGPHSTAQLPQPDTTEQAAKDSGPPPPALPKPTFIKKRYRPAGPPFYEFMYGQNGRKIRIKLEVPAEGDECPLTLSPVKDDCLEFLSQGACFYPAYPEVKKAVLSCGHSFGALNILYHFARRNLLCPCCRAGVDSKLKLACIPPHFRQLMNARVNRELDAEVSEQIREDSALASATFEGLHEHSLINVRQLSATDFLTTRLSIGFYGDALTNGVVIDVPIISYASLEESLIAPIHNAFFMPPGPHVHLLNMQFSDETVKSFTFKTSVLLASRRFDLAMTDQINLDRTQNRLDITTQALAGDTRFQLIMNNEGGQMKITSLSWRGRIDLLSQQIVMVEFEL